MKMRRCSAAPIRRPVIRRPRKLEFANPLLEHLRLPASKLPVNLQDLLRQRSVESERIEYKAGWNSRLQRGVRDVRWTDIWTL